MSAKPQPGTSAIDDPVETGRVAATAGMLPQAAGADAAAAYGSATTYVAPRGAGNTVGSRIMRALMTNVNFVGGLVIILLVVMFAILAPWLYPGDPRDMVGPPLAWPGTDLSFPLGTGTLGSDLAAGLAHGARSSLLVGIAAAFVSLAIGTVLGAIGGYFGGRIDDVVVRFTEIFQTVPSFLLVVVLITIVGSSLTMIIFAIGISSWPAVARLVRAEYRTLRVSDFVLAARSLGYSRSRIIFGEILPNALPPIVVTTSIMAANAILIEASLSFLGLGDPNAISWGVMIGDGRPFLRTEWYLTAIPGAAITITVLSLNLVGDGLNDILNPRSGQQ